MDTWMGRCKDRCIGKGKDMCMDTFEEKHTEKDTARYTE